MKEKLSLYFLYLAPGALILFFSMFALHSSLMLIKAQEKFESLVWIYDHKANALQASYYDLHLSLHEYMGDPNKYPSYMVIEKFATLYEAVRNAMDAVIVAGGRNADKSVYFESLIEIDQKLRALAPQIVELKNTQGDQAKALYGQLYSKIEHISSDMKSLRSNLDTVFDASEMTSEIKSREERMYWSVIAIGLCGFLLVLLNADKLRQLRRNNQEKLRNLGLLQNRLAALEAAHDGIVIIDENSCISFINTAICRMLDIAEQDRAEFLGRTWDGLFAEDEVEILRDDVLPDLYENGYWMGELPFYHDDGSVVYTDISITGLPGGGMIITAMDVTEKQKVQAEKRQFEEQFYQAQKMEAVGRLAGGIAHDFNNILAAINGYAEFLVDDLDTKTEQHKFAQNIILAGKQAKDLVDQILAFSRRKDSQHAVMDFLPPVSEAISMLGASFPKTLEVRSEVKIPQAIIAGNANQISQVLMNICVNARDAMEGDHGVLTIGVESYNADKDFMIPDAVKSDLPDPKDMPFSRIYDVTPAQTRLIVGHLKRGQDYIKLSIEDTGTGISRPIMEHIFEPFFTTKPVDKGTGLGLATVHGVIISHHGALVIDSTIGQGTRFELYFPAMMQGDLNEPVTSDVRSNGVDLEGGARILLVEDQKYVMDMMQKMLIRQGHQVTPCYDGVEAIHFLRENAGEIDLVITDQNMPKMTGIEMIEQIHPECPDLPFLVISGYSEKQMQEMIEHHPAIKGVLRKPVSSAKIQEMIEHVLAQRAYAKNAKIAS